MLCVGRKGRYHVQPRWTWRFRVVEKRRYKITNLNTFDWFGSHKYQHHKRHEEIKKLVFGMQPDINKIKNFD